MSEIIPAILTKESKIFERQLRQVSQFGARSCQIDFTDGKFVSGKTLLPDELDSFVLSQGPEILEAHLMTQAPEQYFAVLYALGFARVAVHLETVSKLDEVIKLAKELSFDLGLAVNPETDGQLLEKYAAEIGFMLFLTVEPGGQGRELVKDVLDKVKLEHLHKLKKQHPKVAIEVDGGVKLDNVVQVAKAGAERIVVGSGIWQSGEPRQAYQELVDKVT
jgi:ribulose-phosphate 3-epimerase